MPTVDRPVATAETTPFEPVVVTRRYPTPSASIDPDRAKGWIRRLLPVVAHYRWPFGLALLMALTAMLAQVAIPAVLRSAVDQSLRNRSSALAPFVIALIALALGRSLVTYGYRAALYRMAFSIDTDLRVLIYNRLSTLDWPYFDRVASGQLISRANSDIRSVQMFLTFAPIIGLTGVQFVVTVIYMASIHLPLTLVAVCMLPLVYVLGVRVRNQMFPLSWISQGRVADVATIVDENIAGVRVVRSFAGETEQLRQLARAAVGLRWANVRTVDARARYNPLIENLPRLSMAAVLAYGGWLAIQGEVSEGTLFAFTAYVTQLQVPFRTLGLFLILGQRAAASAQRIFEVLDERPVVADRPGAYDLVECHGEVRFDNVHFSYRGEPETVGKGANVHSQEVLAGFDLHLKAGETVALVGRTGSGKSTVARLLGRFYDATSGTVSVDGHLVTDLTQVSLRHHVGFVFDEPFLFSVPLADNIAYARPDATQNDIEAAAKDAQAHGFITELPEGYDTLVGERGYTLSGGQRQRVALARALLADPTILVLDDATSAIDAEVEEAIHVAMSRRLATRTTLLIAHRLSTIALADRVILLDAGRVVADGTHGELLDTVALYREVLAQAPDADATVTPETVTPETVTPETVTPETVTPETVTSETVTPETVTPETVTPDTVTSGAATSGAP